MSKTRIAARAFVSRPPDYFKMGDLVTLVDRLNTWLAHEGVDVKLMTEANYMDGWLGLAVQVGKDDEFKEDYKYPCAPESSNS